MLTRDLVMSRTTKGKVRPTFIDTKKASLRSVANDLVKIVAGSEGLERDDIEAAIDGRIGSVRRQKVAKGLKKLVLDRIEVEEPKPDIGERRQAIFLEATATMRALGDDATVEEYDAALAAMLDRPLDEVRADLYADLAGRRKMVRWRPLKGGELLDRYNMALAQGLVIYASSLEVDAPAPDILAVRKVLRWLKFCRLVSSVKNTGDAWRLEVEGPAAIFSNQKKYGLQLASFLPVVPVLGRFTIRAQVELPRKAPAALVLDQDDPLVSPHDRAMGHVPEEVQQVADAFEDAKWSLELTPQPRHVGVNNLCVPDMTFVEAGTGRTVYFELFHRWHAGPLKARLADLLARPDPSLFLGVDRALLKDEEVAAALEGHEQVLPFNAFPKPKKLLRMLERG